MYGWLLGGVGLLLAAYLLARLFAAANPAALARGLRVTAIALLALFGLFVLVRGLPLVAGLLGGLAALVWKSGGLLRLLPLLGLWRAARAAGGAAGAGGASAPPRDGASAVETDWLAMRLDHITGEIDGAVRQGPFAGRRLAELADDELYALWLAVRGDAQSLRLLETFLDRGGDDWRAAFEARARREGAGGAASGGSMTREEALSILGLAEGAAAAEIKAAHRDLMKKFHPDRGGSDYFAAKLNQAKAILLGE